MATDLLNELREMALNLKIEPVAGSSDAATVESIVKVLSEFNRAYQNFLAIALAKDEVYANIIEQQPAAKKQLLAESSLLAVDVNFGSFEVALAPQSSNISGLLFKDDVVAKKEATFKDFKTVVGSDFNDQVYLSRIGSRFSERERKLIYGPIFRAVKSNRYRVGIQDVNRTYVKPLTRPSKEKISFYVPKEAAAEGLEARKTYKLYVTMDADSAARGKFTRSSVDAVHYVEEVAPDTYPIILNELDYEGLEIQFQRAIVGEVRIDDGLFQVENDALDVFVWGDTRKDAEEAFVFAIYSLYVNFYYEADENLSEDAIKLKDELQGLAKSSVWNEG